MGEIVKFDVGCRLCEHLVQTGKNTFTCSARSYMDDSDIVPIENGHKTKDWGACCGQDYLHIKSKHKIKRRSV